MVLKEIHVHVVGDASAKGGTHDPSSWGRKTSTVLTGLVKREEHNEEFWIEQHRVGMSSIYNVDHIAGRLVSHNLGKIVGETRKSCNLTDVRETDSRLPFKS